MRIDIVVISFYQERAASRAGIYQQAGVVFLLGDFIIGGEPVVKGVRVGEIPVVPLWVGGLSGGFLYCEGAAADDPCNSDNSQSERLEFHDGECLVSE